MAYHSYVRVRRCPDQHLTHYSILETRYSDHSSQDDDEAVNVGCSHVLLLRGVIFPAASLFLAYLVSGSQGCFRCQVRDHEFANGLILSPCFNHQWYWCHTSRIL